MAGDLTVPSPPQRSKHRSFTVEFKIGVVEWVEHHSSSVRAASVHFGLDRKVIRSWIRKKQVLREALSTRGTQKRKLHGGRGPASCELDQEVLKYVRMSMKGTKRPGHGGKGEEWDMPGNKHIQEIARECAEKLGVTGFKASGSWLRGWKGRCEVVGARNENGNAAARNDDEKKVWNQSNELESNSQSPCQLTTLKNGEEVSVTSIDGKLGETLYSEQGQSVKDKRTEESDERKVFMDYSNPEHNYTKSHTTPTSHGKCVTPPSCLQSHMALLEGIDFLRPHREVGLELTLGEEMGVAEREGLQHTISNCSELTDMALNSTNGLTQQVLSVPTLSEFPDPSHTPSMLEDEQLSLFNHRSFTDPFPFLPSFICSNWTPPPDYSVDTQATPTHSDSKRSYFKTNNSSMKSSRVEESSLQMKLSRYHTRSTTNLSSSFLPLTSPPPHYGSLHSPPPGARSLLGSSQTPGGLLANRRSQPTFPDEPEIVFNEIQLGPLHTTLQL